MKRFLFIMILCCTSLVLFAQKGKIITTDTAQMPKPSSDIPPKIRSAFDKAYPDAVVNGWYKENNNYKVIFRKPPALQQLVVYNKEGKVVRKETELHSNDFPSAVVEYYKSNYPGEKEYVIWVSQDEKGVTTYYSPIHDYTIYFDKDGKFIRQEKRLPNEEIK